MYWSDVFVGRRNRFYSIGGFGWIWWSVCWFGVDLLIGGGGGQLLLLLLWSVVGLWGGGTGFITYHHQNTPML